MQIVKLYETKTQKGYKKIKGKKGVGPSTLLQQETFKGEQSLQLFTQQ